MATYHVVSEDIQESSAWLRQNMQTLQGMEGISQYLEQVGTAFEDTDSQTANALQH